MGGLDTGCLYSSVRNTSGVRRKFAFLPPHGRELAAGEKFSIFGHVQESLITFDRIEAHRSIVAFENALKRGDLEIIETPMVVLEDKANPGSTKVLRLLNGTLGTINPCWNTSDSDPVEFEG